MFIIVVALDMLIRTPTPVHIESFAVTAVWALDMQEGGSAICQGQGAGRRGGGGREVGVGRSYGFATYFLTYLAGDGD